MNSNGTEGNRVCEYVLFRPLVTVINVIKSILFDVSHFFFLLLLLNNSDQSKSDSFHKSRKKFRSNIYIQCAIIPS